MDLPGFSMVGVARIELATPAMSTQCPHQTAITAIGAACAVASGDEIYDVACMIDDNFLSEDRFSAAVGALPLVSIDLCLTNSANQLLLGRRSNPPAQGYWFTLGGRVRRGESQRDTFTRLMKQEAGIQSVDFERARLMGIWDHFYDDSRFSTSIGTHYVNIPYWIELNDEEAASVIAHDQHSAWRWIDCPAVQITEKIHPYAQAYIDWIARRYVGLQN